MRWATVKDSAGGQNPTPSPRWSQAVPRREGKRRAVRKMIKLSTLRRIPCNATALIKVSAPESLLKRVSQSPRHSPPPRSS